IAMAVAHNTVSLDKLNALSAEELLAWAAEEYGDRAGIVTSFQNTGCVSIDIAVSQGKPLRVLTVDTLRLHPETYALMDEVERRYGISIERFQPEPARVQRMVEQHGEFLFFDSKPKQEYCCSVRKVEPNQRALATLDVWITGLRRDQSSFRQDTAKASFVTQNGRNLL